MPIIVGKTAFDFRIMIIGEGRMDHMGCATDIALIYRYQIFEVRVYSNIH